MLDLRMEDVATEKALRRVKRNLSFVNPLRTGDPVCDHLSFCKLLARFL